MCVCVCVCICVCVCAYVHVCACVCVGVNIVHVPCDNSGPSHDTTQESNQLAPLSTAVQYI